MPVDRALASLANQVKKPLIRDRLNELLEAVRSGQTLSATMSEYPRLFPALYVQMVKAGEASGQLEEVLTNLAGYLEKEAHRRAQVKSMLTYPIFVIFAALAAAIFVVVFVIPQVQGIFADFDQALPAPTRLLLGMSAFVVQKWPFLLGGVLAAVGIVVWIILTQEWRLPWDRVRLRLPIMGDIWQKLAAARFTRTLGTLLQGGVPVLEALSIAEGATGNTWVAACIKQAAGRVREGVRLADALSGGPIPSMALEMMGLGEETGRLENELTKVADTYDFETDIALKNLASLAEPAIMIFIGVLLAFIIIAVVLPIFSLSSTV
jgi:type II secretory pathway component PulF